jgi:2,4-dienoyl-CoA reductase-like NADH-dependent reductase (Old Yellow Enzyme family)
MSLTDRLFEPINIGSIRSKNRIAFAATTMGAAAPDRSISDQTLCNYVARSKGGAGWVTVEHIFRTNRYGASVVCFHSDRYLRSMRELSEVIHAFR